MFRLVKRSVVLSAGLWFASVSTAAEDGAEVAASTATAKDPQLKELLNRVEAKYKDVKGFSARFVQVARNEALGDETSEGEVHIMRPSKMRWSFDGGQMFVTDGQKMWVYAADIRQVTEYDDLASMRSSSDELLSSLDKLDEHFSVELLSTGEQGHELKLVPKQPGQYKHLKLKLDADLRPAHVVMTDAFNAVVELTFKDVKMNPALADDLFRFTPPEGVEVIKAKN